MDCGLLGSSVHGILQARILEWAAYPFSLKGPLLLQSIRNRLYCVKYLYICDASQPYKTSKENVNNNKSYQMKQEDNRLEIILLFNKGNYKLFLY